MIIVNLDNVSVTYVNLPIFEGLSWEIHNDRVAGFVGPNGAGKSTILRLILGDLTTDTGFLTRKTNLTIGYLPQEPKLEPGRTVWQEALTASAELGAIEHDLAQVEHRLADPAVYEDEKLLTRALAHQSRLLDQFVLLGGPGYEGRVRATLASLGFSETDMDLPVEVLSGGQKKLLGLARLLITQPELLLLDEPDNHLDLDGKAFIEKLLRDYKGGVIIVSHDRYLLDLVADEIVELEDGRLTRYPGNYSEYAFDKGAALLRQQQMFVAQQKEINRLEQSAKRLMLWGKLYSNEKFSQRGKSMLKRIEKIDRIDRPALERKRMGLELAGWRGSHKVLELRDVSKIFPLDDGGENIVLAGLDLLIHHGERVGLVGPNGAGKSVLFKLILDQMAPTEGEIILGPSVEVGYYAQEHEILDPERTLVDVVRYAAEWPEDRAVAFLGKFLFTYEHSRSKVKTLSGGERSRLQMALLMLSKANFLLLDEPTNNLDIASAEVLEEAMESFEGTVLVISHDRYFLDRVVDRIVALEEGSLVEYVGNFSEYWGKK